LILVVMVAALSGACARDKGSEAATASKPSSSARPAIAEVVSVERFEIEGELDGNVLTFTLNTDLPPTAIVGVHVSRGYVATSHYGGTATYRPYYWEHSSTVEALRTPQTIKLDDRQWAAIVDEAHEISAARNEPMKILSVLQSVTLELTVPMSVQPPPLARNGENMIGKMVIVEPYGRYIRAEQSFPSEFTAPVGAPSQPSVAPRQR
jgi:hypothetical protein